MKPTLYAVLVSLVLLMSGRAFALDLLTWNTDEGSAESIARKLDKIAVLGQDIRAKMKTGALPISLRVHASGSARYYSSMG